MRTSRAIKKKQTYYSFFVETSWYRQQFYCEYKSEEKGWFK